MQECTNAYVCDVMAWMKYTYADMYEDEEKINHLAFYQNSSSTMNENFNGVFCHPYLFPQHYSQPKLNSPSEAEYWIMCIMRSDTDTN